MPFTLFIPVYNEEEILEKNADKLIRFLDKKKLKYEIIVVSNGSTDKTVEIGGKLEKKLKKFRFFHTDKRGVGNAILIGIKSARYPKFITADMDLSTEMEFVPKADKLLDKHDIVVGSKMIGEQQRQIHRLILSKSFIGLTRLLLGLSYHDYSIAAKAYKTDILKKNKDMINAGSSYVINIIYRAKKAKKKITEIPVFCNDTRKSKFNLIAEIWHRFWHLIWLRIRG